MAHKATYDVPSAAARRFGLSIGGNRHEWHVACPFRCSPGNGGKDRFRIFEDGGYWCGNCGAKGWLDDNKRGFTPDPLAVQRLEDLQKQQQQEARDKQTKWELAHAHAPWQQWSEQMPEEKWQEWMNMGVPESFVPEYTLGWIPAKRIWEDGLGELNLPAFTIPIHAPANCRVVNVQFRVENPPEGVGKYRQERGIAAAAFYLNKLTTGDVIVCEGAKKAMILGWEMEMAMQIIGLPSNVPGVAVLETIAAFNFETIYLMLDPNSDLAIKRAIKYLGARTRVSRLPDKPDDLITKYGWRKDKFKLYMKMARKEGV